MLQKQRGLEVDRALDGPASGTCELLRQAAARIMRPARHLLALALSAPVACGPADEGALQPQATPGVTIGKRTVAGDTAEIDRRNLQVRAWGNWGRESGATIDITYRNRDQAPIRIRIDALAITHGTRAATIEQVTDVTGVNLTDDDHRNDIGRSLMGGPDDRRPAILMVPAGEVRQVSVSFLPFVEGQRSRIGDVLTLALPLASGTISVPFRCGGP